MIERKVYAKDIEKAYYEQQLVLIDQWSQTNDPDLRYDKDPILKAALQEVVTAMWEEKDINKRAALIANSPKKYNVTTWEECEDLARMYYEMGV